ncbi:MAG TPA: hypothetical protein VJL61_00415 [Rhodanobacteraceae bacterium]|nr:hypothetical protein [Rhodanobacteraceae bacterium]
MLAFLVLGLIVQPVLNHVGNLHAMEHAQSADTAGNGHEHGGNGDLASDPGHPQGAHTLMHLAMGGATADIAPTVVLPSAMPLPELTPLSNPTDAPSHHPSTPFRPPIV